MRIALIGAGSIGKRHLINSIQSGVRHITIYDSEQKKLKEAKKKAEETFNKAKSFLQIELVEKQKDLFKKGVSFDAMIIATPPSSHPFYLEKALQFKIPVLCEKPLCKDDENFRNLCSLICEINRRKILNMTAYNYRFWPQLQKLKSIIETGKYGKVLSIRGSFSENLRDWHPWEGINFYMSSKRLGGGALLDESHLIDIVRWIFGEIKTISAINKTISSLRREKIFKTDDIVEIIAELKSGAVASIHMDLFGKYHEKKLEIITEKSKIEWHFDNTDLRSNNIKIFSGKRRLQSSQVGTREAPKILSAGKLERNAMYLRQIKHFLHCIKNKKQIRGDVACLKDGFQTMSVLQAARRSARCGRKVEVLQNAFYSDKK